MSDATPPAGSPAGDPPPKPAPAAPAPEAEIGESGAAVVVVEEGEEVSRLPLPRRNRGEIFGVASQLLGAARIKVMCEDNVSRMGRITGKMKKKMWIREGDLLVVRPWGFQEGKADIIFRYSRTQATYLARRNLVPAVLDIYSQAELPAEGGSPAT